MTSAIEPTSMIPAHTCRGIHQVSSWSDSISSFVVSVPRCTQWGGPRFQLVIRPVPPLLASWNRGQRKDAWAWAMSALLCQLIDGDCYVCLAPVALHPWLINLPLASLSGVRGADNVANEVVLTTQTQGSFVGRARSKLTKNLVIIFATFVLP